MCRTLIIASNHPSLEGHFPENPMVPGAVLLEEVLNTIQAAYPEKVCSSMSKLKFAAPVPIDDVFTIEVIEISETQISVRVEHAGDMLFLGKFDLSG